MPVTDLSGDDDWLQQFLAGHQAGQAFGASQPYGPSGSPGPYSGGPQGLMPGGGVMNRQQMTPGGPSLGYPALGQPTPQQPPTAAPGPAQGSALGYSLTSNPVTNWFRNNVSVGAPNFRNISPDFFHDMSAIGQKIGPWFGGASAAPSSSPAAPATAPPAGAPSRGIGSDANFPVMGAGSFPTTYGAPGQQPPTPTGPVSGANPANRGVGTTRTPGAGAPQGNPAQTPTPASATRTPSRFVQVDRPNMDVAGGGMGRGGPPQMTALNLAGLFGGRGQQGANPANLPAANAQPVRGALAAGGMSNAPWGMGPLQPGMNWPGSMGPFTQDQFAARGLRQRYG